VLLARDVMDPERSHRVRKGKSAKLNSKKITLSAMAGSMPFAKKLKLLREREAMVQEKIRVEVQAWFDQFDTNCDSQLERDELRALLTHLHPLRPPNEKNLDKLIYDATAVKTHTMHLPGNKNGTVGFHSARETVQAYAEHCKDEEYLDSIFDQFDTNGDAELDELEVRRLWLD
jgi:hypothetical protein